MSTLQQNLIEQMPAVVAVEPEPEMIDSQNALIRFE